MSQEDIYDAAAHIVDTQGLRALTMRRLAEATGVAPMSLYRFAASKEQLVARLCEHMMGELEPADPALAWRDRLTHELVSFRAAVRRHAGLIDLLTNGDDAVPALDGLRERVLSIVREADIDDRTAFDAVGSLFAMALGFGVATRARGIGPDSDTYGRLKDLSGETFPNLHAMAGQYAEHWSDHAFEFGVRTILDSIEG